MEKLVTDNQHNDVYPADLSLPVFYKKIQNTVQEAENALNGLADLFEQDRLTYAQYMWHLACMFNLCPFQNEVDFRIPDMAPSLRPTFYQQLQLIFLQDNTQRPFLNSIAFDDKLLPSDPFNYNGNKKAV